MTTHLCRLTNTDNKREIDHPVHRVVNISVGKSAGLNEQHAIRRLVAATAVGHSDTGLSPSVRPVCLVSMGGVSLRTSWPTSMMVIISRCSTKRFASPHAGRVGNRGCSQARSIYWDASQQGSIKRTAHRTDRFREKPAHLCFEVKPGSVTYRTRRCSHLSAWVSAGQKLGVLLGLEIGVCLDIYVSREIQPNNVPQSLVGC